MGKISKVASVFVKGGGGELLNQVLGSQRLTVLCYHRVADPFSPNFDEYRPIVSCTPKLFAQQMDYVQKHFSPIDLATLDAFVHHDKPLPQRPLLITFDDGYLDNYTAAYPILKQRGLPAVIFLMTDYMGQSRLPWWDTCAYLFKYTKKSIADLPELGHVDLSTESAKNTVRSRLMTLLKQVPETQKQSMMHALQTALAVDVRQTKRLFVSWDEVRDLVANGVTCQPHTVTHPIMTRISPEEARQQVRDSKAKIEAETDQACYAFAYPNGTPVDYSEDTKAALRENNYRLAFTLSPGPTSLPEVKQDPLAIRRVYLSMQDTFDLFVLKVMGVPKVMSGLG